MEVKVVLMELNVLSQPKVLDKPKVLTELQVLKKVETPKQLSLCSFSQSGRQHGSRGCASRANSRSSSNKTKTVKWRSGASPPAPTFEGGIDVDPYCA